MIVSVIVVLLFSAMGSPLSVIPTAQIPIQNDVPVPDGGLVIAEDSIFLWAGNSTDDLPESVPFILIDDVESVNKPHEFTVYDFMHFGAVGVFITIPFVLFGYIIAQIFR